MLVLFGSTMPNKPLWTGMSTCYGIRSELTVRSARFYSRQRHFVELPETYNTNNSNDLILNSVIAWSFYPKILTRDGKGWRNVANNQSVSLHPISVNKGVQPPRYLSFYHIMQSNNKWEYQSSGKAMANRLPRFYNAHETSATEDFAIALICGDADFKVRIFLALDLRLIWHLVLWTGIQWCHHHWWESFALLDQ